MKDAPLLSHRIGYLLKQAQGRLSAELGEALAPFRLHPRELAVLAVIHASGEQPSQMELAEWICLDRTSMVGAIDSLERNGYVERRRSDQDRRRNVITLTPEGERCLAEAEQARERVERSFLAPLDPQAAAALVDALATLHRAHGAGPATHPGCPG
ncbi:MarR family winged helix-turn-helix transcriptional regulator [Streptomyces fragilis]|uniref:MarR family winged helix-turn-helix transcriptional regulator n=1 Tax=Streptomyces fragilis TaxID=67301 RepID=A0ABV2YJN1_9ACTN|nr:MarR family winged helix-turn-helix transcriptional regulator [Streptomyces fragilis]